VGEIGRDRHEYLYEMRWYEILLIIQGYRKRNVLQYQLQRIQAWAAAFSMGNPNHKKPKDLVDLYFDHYITPVDDEPKIDPETVAELQEEMKQNPFLKD